jgi:hypothetical protein
MFVSSQMLQCSKTYRFLYSQDLISYDRFRSAHVEIVMIKSCSAFDSQASSFWRQGGSYSSTWKAGFDMPIAVDHLHVCEPVLPFSKAERRCCSHIPEALPPPGQCYSYTTTSSSRTALVPKARHLANRTVGFSIWASDLESVQELKPRGLDSWRNLALPEERDSETPLRLPFPLNVTPLPQTLTDPLLECRRQRLALVMVRVIWVYHSAATLSS